MAIQLTERARLSAQQTAKEPSIVVEFDGIDTVFGSAQILKVIRIGDDGLEIGNSWKIGGSVPIGDQETAISFDSDVGNTTTKIDFKLNPDRGFGTGVSSMEIAFVDDQANTILGIFTDNEMLGRKCKVWISPDKGTTTFKEDYVVAFRGIVDGIEAPPGGVLLTISHPDQKKRQTIFASFEGELDGAIDASTTSITLDSTNDLLTPITGPDGSIDTAMKFYVRIDDEIIRYTGKTPTTITGVTRAQLGTTAASHDDGASVTSFYTLEGNSIDLALKVMLSGWDGPYQSGIEVTSVGPGNTLFFRDRDVNVEYGLTVGDYITTSGFSNSANNVSLKEVTDITRELTGDRVTVTGVSFVEEAATGVMAIRSKYDTLPTGMRMGADEVDVLEHERLRTLFLSSFDYLFYLDETIDNGKDWIEQQIYSPIACYSIPRKARASVGYHIGPLPTTLIKTLDEKNVKMPSRIRKKRSIGRNFYNTIIYKYNKDTLEDKYLSGQIFTNAESRTQIPVGTRTLTISADGLRSGNTAQANATRRLNRYAFAAEHFSQVRILFKDGFNLEVGDLVIFDGRELKVADFSTGDRSTPPKLYEVVSKSLDIRSGDVSLELIDTNFSTANRYALISPASRVQAGLSASAFIIASSYASVFDDNEYLKWSRFLPDLTVRVRNDAYSTAATANVTGFSGNTVRVDPPLPFTPSSGMIMEMASYPQASDKIKLVYGFIAENASGFSNDDEPYRMI